MFRFQDLSFQDPDEQDDNKFMRKVLGWCGAAAVLLEELDPLDDYPYEDEDILIGTLSIQCLSIFILPILIRHSTV